eukprot:gene155-biopygen63
MAIWHAQEPFTEKTKAASIFRGLQGCHDDLARVVLIELRALDPLVDVVRVLPQDHRGHELRPPPDEVLQPRHQQGVFVSHRFARI